MQAVGVQDVPRLLDTISFKVHDPNKNDHFASGDKIPFYQNLSKATQFGFEYVSCTNDQNKYDFGINMCFYNDSTLTGTDVQENKGKWRQNPDAMYRLNLLEILDVTDDREILIKRDLLDIVKDLTNAKIRVSMNGAKEILRKFAKDVYREDLLNKTLDELLNTFKYGLPPSPEQMTIKGVLSRDGRHDFTIPDEEQGASKIAFRDSGPKSETVDPNFANNLIIKSNIDLLELLKLDIGIIHNKITQYTIGNHKDPASNVTTNAWMSCLFNNFLPSFYSPFVGSTTDKLSLGLYTRRTKTAAAAAPDTHKLFVCDVEIIHNTPPPRGAPNPTLYTTHVEYNNVLCDMNQTNRNGFSHDGTTNHKYSDIKGDVLLIGSGAKTSKAFFDDIAGNNNKNSFFLNYMNKMITDTKKAEGLSKLRLKAAGDPDQVLVILQEILHYALLRFKAHIIDFGGYGTVIQKSLHFFFVDTLKKYLLITCDGVLAALARRLMLSYVLQQNNSIIYVKYEDTSEEVKALSIFCSMKEKLKKDLEKYMSLLSQCNSINTLYISYADGSIFPVTSKTGGRGTEWCNLDENIKLLKIAIQKHFTEIESLSSTVVNDVTPEKTAQLTRIVHIFNIPPITKTTKDTLHGCKLYIYHLNYLQSLTLLLSSGLDITYFLFCTKRTNNDTNARNHPDFVGCITAYNLLSPPQRAAATSPLPPSPPAQSSSASSASVTLSSSPSSPAPAPAPAPSSSSGAVGERAAPSSPLLTQTPSPSPSPAPVTLSYTSVPFSPPSAAAAAAPSTSAAGASPSSSSSSSSSAPPPSPSAAEVKPSFFEQEVCSDVVVSDFLKCHTGTRAKEQARESVAQPNGSQIISASRSITRSTIRLNTRSTISSHVKTTDELIATKLNDEMRSNVYNTRAVAARMKAAECTFNRNRISVERNITRRSGQGGGGKSHESIVQKGGCQHSEIFSMENLYGLLGDKAICKWVDRPSMEPKTDTKIYIDCNKTDSEGFNTLSVELPYLQYYLFALLSDGVFEKYLNKFLGFIATGEIGVIDPETSLILSLYDMVQEYILILKCNSKITDETRRIKEAVAAAAAAAAVVCTMRDAETNRAKASVKAASAAAAASGVLDGDTMSVPQNEAKVAEAALVKIEREAVKARAEEAAAAAAREEAEKISTHVVGSSVDRAIKQVQTMESVNVQGWAEMEQRKDARKEQMMMVRRDAAKSMMDDEEGKNKMNQEAMELEARELEAMRLGGIFYNMAKVAEQLETEARIELDMVVTRNPTICRKIEIFIQSLTHVNLYGLCKLIDSVDNDDEDDNMPVTESYSGSIDRVNDYIEDINDDDDGGGGGGGGGGGARCSMKPKPEFSLGKFVQVIRCLCSDGRRLEAATAPLKDRSIPSILLQLRDLENIATVRTGGDHKDLTLKIEGLIPIVRHCIKLEVEKYNDEVQAIADADSADAAAAGGGGGAADLLDASHEEAAVPGEKRGFPDADADDGDGGDGVPSASVRSTKSAKTEDDDVRSTGEESVRSVNTDDHDADAENAVKMAVAAAAAEAAPKSLELFTQAEQALRRLPLESRTDPIECTAFLCSCGAALVKFVVESSLSLDEITPKDSPRFRYISAVVVEEACSVERERSRGVAAAAGDESDADTAKAADDAAKAAATAKAAEIERSIAKAADQLVSDSVPNTEGGRRRPVKKSTHRKPRRLTRNYQSRNKRKNHSIKKTTIKHRKSYRKHNRTIKRRKSRRHH